MSDELESWGWKGSPRPVVPEILARLQMHSPDLYAQLRWYMQSQEESVEARTTHDGVDSSAALSVQLLEALIWFTKVRMEILDQIDLSPVKGKIPAHFQLAMSELMSLEPVLLQAATSAMQLHLQVWNAHAEAVPWADRPGPSSKPKEERGRWVRNPNRDEGDEDE